MTKGRSDKRRSSSLQPSLPGLLPDSPFVTRHLPTPREQALDRARLRLVFVLFMFGILYTVIAGRLTTLTLFSNGPEAQVTQAASGEMPPTSRANIVDRNGIVLATSLPAVTLSADTKKILNPDEVIEKLRAVLPDLDEKKLAEELRVEKRCFVVKRHLTPRQYYAINKLGIAGLEFSPDEVRMYPSGNVTSHVLGFTDIDNVGIAGMEKSLNAQLQQKPEPVALTLDLSLQTIMHRELSAAVKEYRALGAAGLIMDATNGEILALVSLPDFDPLRAGSAGDDAKFNRATLGVYEMGSTFKVFTTALAFDSGLIRPSDRFDTTHPLEVGGKTIKDFHPSKYPLNVAEIFMESSNIGAAKMAEKIGASRQRAFLKQLGLLDRAPLELPETGAPLVPSASNWRDATTMTVAFGHGIAVNAVQLASAAASIMNDGLAVKPTLLKPATADAYTGTERIISSRSSAMMRALMRLVVTHGTAKAAEVPGYVVGGKTGTADKITNGQYCKDARMSSFIGVFPAYAPRYIVFALLDDPKGNAKTYGYATGGWTAAPVVGRVISQIGPLLDLPPINADIQTATEQQLLRPLGRDTLNTLHLGKEMDNYASVETNRAR